MFMPSGVIAAAGNPAPPAPLTLDGGSGGTVSQTDPSSPYDTTVAIRFNIDGTVEAGVGLDGGGISWSPRGNWITGGVPDNSYSVRCTSVVVVIGPGSWTTSPVADDSWISLVDAVRTWESNKSAAGERNFTCTFEVRKTAGPPPATGASAYTFAIDNVI